MVYYVYYSQQKIAQLYRQLAESRIVWQTCSKSESGRMHAGLQPQKQEHKHHHLNRLDGERTQSLRRESRFEHNDMYQLRRVLQTLERGGNLKQVHTQTAFCPGCYYKFSGCFTPEDSQAPESFVWLSGDNVRLLCHKKSFSEFEELWVCAESLPLCGVALAMAGEETLCGLPLALWLK